MVINTPDFRKTKFEIENGNQYEGYTKGEHWNGWECPRFTKEVGLQIVEEINTFDSKAWFDESKDKFCFDLDNTGEDIYEFEGYNIKVGDGGTLHVYPIGAWCWIWDEVEEEEEEIA